MQTSHTAGQRFISGKCHFLLKKRKYCFMSLSRAFYTSVVSSVEHMTRKDLDVGQMLSLCILCAKWDLQ